MYEPNGSLDQQAYAMLAWPTGLRRLFWATVSSEAWFRFPPLPILSMSYDNVCIIVIIAFIIIDLFSFCFKES